MSTQKKETMDTHSINAEPFSLSEIPVAPQIPPRVIHASPPVVHALLFSPLRFSPTRAWRTKKDLEEKTPLVLTRFKSHILVVPNSQDSGPLYLSFFGLLIYIYSISDILFLGGFERVFEREMVCSRHTVPSWLSAASRVDFDGGATANVSVSESVFAEGLDASSHHHHSNTLSDATMGIAERAFSAAGAAVLSAVLVNPLDVVKTRLQAQAAGVPYSPPNQQMSRCMASLGPSTIFSDARCSPSCTRGGILGTEPFCPPDCFQYKGTMDVFSKIIRQEGVARLWRGTNASLALAVPTVGIYLPCYDIFRNWIEEFTAKNAPTLTPYAPLVAGSLARSLACITCSPIELARTRMQAYKEFQIGAKPPGMWKTLVGALPSVRSASNLQSFQGFRILWTGVGAQLARDVPFSAICWSTLEPIRRRLLGLVGEEANAASVLGANFSAGFVAGSLAAAATCPLDVVKTRRQIERDPTKAMRMTTRQTLIEVWRDGKMKGLFTGIGPRVARAGPSVGIVVSFYEVVKYALHQRRSNS